MDRARRKVLLAVPSLVAGIALGQAPPGIAQAYEERTRGRIGIYIENLATGNKFQWRAQERFRMCSTFKASLAGMVLSRVDSGREDLASEIHFGATDLQEYAPTAGAHLSVGHLSIGAMCEASVELSDNTCANLLLSRMGGPAELTRFWRSIGDPVTRIDDMEPEMNRSPEGDPHNTTSPFAMATTLRQLALGTVLSPASRERFIEWMVNCKTGANRLRAGLPLNWKIADKTGNNGRDSAGDIAVVWPNAGAPTLVCAYTEGGSPSEDQLTEIFMQIGRLVPNV